MKDYRFMQDSHGHEFAEVALTDYQLLYNPLLNKGMSFPENERTEFRLHGLLPPDIQPLEEQYIRSYNMLQHKQTMLGRYGYLRDLQDSNETLFYYLVLKRIEECLPIIYTPGVGEGCLHFSEIYRRPRGLFLSYPHRDHMDLALSNPKFHETEVIVVSDGERILGLGDQGAQGMGIPIGKLSLYTACAGIHPKSTLPIILDTGTDNQNLIKDPLYIGWRHPRVRGKEYDDFIDQFVQNIKKRFPNVLLQWEDFAQRNATPILERYRDELLTFNDDIQGTASVATGTLLAAVQVTGMKLRDVRVAVVGAGSAGCGVSNLILRAMVEDGLSEEEARRRFFLIDRWGLLVEGMELLPFQKPFAQPKEAVAHWKKSPSDIIGLLDVMKNAHPTLLIGVSGQPGIFTEEAVKEMASHVKRPIIFPLSNPTDRSEATPDQLYQWTNGKAIVGTGSPFGIVTKNGKPFRVDQTNNSYIFPGLGLGLIAVQAKRIPDSMFMTAAKALAAASPAKLDPEANLLPPLSKIREVSFQVALAVAKEAVHLGLSDCPAKEIEQRIHAKIWTPEYVPYKKMS